MSLYLASVVVIDPLAMI